MAADTRTSLPAFSSTSGSPSAAAGWAASSRRGGLDLSYMHRPPRIAPNYGRKYKEALRLKTNLPRVLLYDNVTEKTVLDVQLSDILSQRARTQRELNLQKKSFILKKQQRDKALKKLTKVLHGQDYEQFQLESSGALHERGGGTDDGSQCLKSSTVGSLPDIRLNNKLIKDGSMSRSGAIKVKSKRQKAPIRDNSDNSLTSKKPSPRSVDGVTTPERLNVVFSAAEDAHGDNTTAHDSISQRKIVFTQEKGSNGTTRIFHTLSREGVKDIFDAVDVISDANRPTEKEIEPLGAQELNTTEDLLIPESQELIRPYSDSDKPAFNLQHPMLDSRFELLQKILVRQDPPNEGFLELSPSFQNRSPEIKLLSRRRKDKRTAKQRDNILEDRKSKMSQGVTPELSDGESVDSENDGKNERRNSHDHEGMKRLGVF